MRLTTTDAHQVRIAEKEQNKTMRLNGDRVQCDAIWLEECPVFGSLLPRDSTSSLKFTFLYAWTVYSRLKGHVAERGRVDSL